MSCNIPIKNIYYMLSYAFQILNKNGYKQICTEEFKNTGDMFAAILIKGIEFQIKRLLNREYITEKDSLSAIRGKIELNDSINSLSFLKHQLVCSYDEFSIDSYMNRILKSTVNLLIHSNISKKRKIKLKNLLVYFSSVHLIDLHRINWKFHYNRNNQSYRMLMGICYLAVKGLLQTQENGSKKLMDFLDEQRMSRLYEKFILEYYKKHFPEFHPSSSEIEWQLDDENSYLLPKMQSDILLEKDKIVLIIDAKFYSHNTQILFNKHSVHSANLYQIFTYVKNKQAEVSTQKAEVTGLLLYAKTYDEIQPDSDYKMSGNRISVKNLNLNCDFEDIKKQLNHIISVYFSV